MGIGIKAIEEIAQTAKVLMQERLPELQQAYQGSEGTFTLGITAKMKPCPEGTRIEIGVNFVQSRVKESVVRIVNDEQMGLGFEPKES